MHQHVAVKRPTTERVCCHPIAADVAGRHAHGTASDHEVAAAWDAAWAAARDAAQDAAWDAARGAAWAAAWAAAKDAARAAAWAAAQDAAQDAAWAAARDDAWDAARDAQAARLRTVCAQIDALEKEAA